MKLRFFIPTAILAFLMTSCDVFASFWDGGIPPTNTILPTSDSTSTKSPEATLTSIPLNTITPVPLDPTPTQKISSPTSTPVVNGDDLPDGEDNKIIYDLQPGSPTRIHAWSHDCSWLGVAGQVFNESGQPVEGLIVESGGNLAGQNILGLSITGMEQLYGPGGYEIKLGEQPMLTTKSVWIQIKDTSGELISEKIFLDTVDDCNQNLLILNFIQKDSLSTRVYYFPLIRK